MNLFTPIDHNEIQRLTFRRQFVLSPRRLDKFSHWNHRSVAGKWTVHAHPDLGLTQVRDGQKELTLLGFCLNPDHPEQTNADIAAWLLAGTASLDELLRKTHRLGGRWVMIFSHPGGDSLFTDACGMRLAHFAVNRPDGPWCFTQPEAVKDVLQLQLNREAVDGFFSTPYYLNCIEHWWPGNDTHYEGVKHLCPNHYLDLRTSQVIRFWPWRKLEPRSMSEVLPEASALLRNSYAAAARRFPLALPLTAGWDSRLLLAASRAVSHEIYYYTLQYNSHKQDHRDLEIPPRLMARLGRPHHAIECPAGMARSFSEIYFKNVTLSHHATGPIVYGLYRHFPKDHVSLKGLCGEIARCFFYKYGVPETLDGRMLAVMALGATRQNDYAVRHFDRWLEGARPAAARYGHHLLDLFQWEQKVANLVGSIESECDIAYETLALYNNRALLETLLSVPERYRHHPDYVLQRKLIQHLWPETLLEPINPTPIGEKLQAGVRNCERQAKTALKRLRLFDTAKRIYRQARPAKG